ncbi:ATP synthase F0 subunit A [Candidatus Nomurabacteria bacterium RIFCSPHIGHO2_02_FULL_37_45]|uniref:ATP synthase subunit a n=1 Tax=Candidatus Nomurabacteria bacterium RIFCSPHIGHO2_12_FULL_37_29 TaxID=1801759 RepID=A0A1F6WC36_9BACT|nr:MAG: ATP synthase F0 subunit A [Candidatus Nomurabacteria bacterium RIFCSPHIGHO2_02_FULL_37_45]OGI79468.1 MAG: ATP synthase F0 subunit A [Candidatus Nomurabacteria bacterium RIFCSPHIGHO2_12_FULL_37_29]OGI85205.1 MAG: ATP synthase F0 subunit A [Candidatus Nomurabacteria bacterium RIFCSPLOWO2_01_FULL_37_49]
MAIEQATTGTGGELAHEITLFAEPIFHYKDFTITNALFTSWFAVAIIIVISLVLRSKLRVIPGKIQNLFEIIVESALGLCDQVTNSRALSLRIFPIAISVFFFILLNNWLGILPLGGFGIIETGDHGMAFIPYLRGGTADINTTIALAVMAVIGANIFGVFSIGLWKTFNKYVNLKVLGGIFTKVRHEPTIIIVAPITFFVGLIEIVGEFAKIASLSFRLFGNVFAGEVLLVSMAALVAYIIPIPFLFLELLVGIIQALIFSILLVVYFTIGATDHEEHEEILVEKVV